MALVDTLSKSKTDANTSLRNANTTQAEAECSAVEGLVAGEEPAVGVGAGGPLEQGGVQQQQLQQEGGQSGDQGPGPHLDVLDPGGRLRHYWTLDTLPPGEVPRALQWGRQTVPLPATNQDT